jgi:hypothetical protein
VLTPEHLLDLGGFHFGFEGFERPLQISDYVLARLGPLEEHAQIVELAGQRVAQLEFFTETAASPEGFLRFGLVLPEIGSGNAFFYRGELAARVGRVKDSSAGLWRV